MTIQEAIDEAKHERVKNIISLLALELADDPYGKDGITHLYTMLQAKRSQLGERPFPLTLKQLLWSVDQVEGNK